MDIPRLTDRAIDHLQEELAIKYLDMCTRKRNILMNKRIMEPLTQEEDRLLKLYNEYSHKLRIRISEINLEQKARQFGDKGPLKP